MEQPDARFEASKTEWDRIAETQEFKDLMATKKVFIIPAFVFFLVYYVLLPILVGYAPQFMSTKVIGVVNLAYLFALSQFFMAWSIAWLYVKPPRGGRHSLPPHSTISEAPQPDSVQDLTRPAWQTKQHFLQTPALIRSCTKIASSSVPRTLPRKLT